MRKRPPHYARDYRRRRIIADPNYAKKEQQRRRHWLTLKLARCPQYAEVSRLNNRLNKLREQVRSYTARLKRTERELIATAKRYNTLREQCRGK